MQIEKIKGMVPNFIYFSLYFFNGELLMNEKKAVINLEPLLN